MKSERVLPISSYVILGLLATCGPQTPYELKKLVDGSIGYFWDFPRAQLYVDPERLAQEGLVAEEREAEGRRRRTYHVTDTGQAALRAWLQEPTVTEVELRDAGLLKLYFGAMLTQGDIVALAQREEDLHRHRLAEYEAIRAHLEHEPETAFALATVRMGIRYELMSIQYWAEIAENPPSEQAIFMPAP
jgi:DNA-binding PadR family transcriptional regulator